MRRDGAVHLGALRGLTTGEHRVSVRSTCSFGDVSVTVGAGAIARAEFELQTAPGALTVTATPPGATVRVDGVAVGPAPWTGNDLMCGEHVVLVEAVDFLAETHRVTVGAGYLAAIDVGLVAAQFGTLVLDVEPLEANVWLDGQAVGAGPRTVDHLPVGSHAVEATLPGYHKRADTVAVAADQVVRVTLHLDRQARASEAGTGGPIRGLMSSESPCPL